MSLTFICLSAHLAAEEELSDVRSELQKISADLKTLEKAFYKTSEIQTKKFHQTV